jgi:hypothetical protein
MYFNICWGLYVLEQNPELLQDLDPNLDQPPFKRVRNLQKIIINKTFAVHSVSLGV